jgi:hypothetical protein
MVDVGLTIGRVHGRIVEGRAGTFGVDTKDRDGPEINLGRRSCVDVATPITVKVRKSRGTLVVFESKARTASESRSVPVRICVCSDVEANVISLRAGYESSRSAEGDRVAGGSSTALTVARLAGGAVRIFLAERRRT